VEFEVEDALQQAMKMPKVLFLPRQLPTVYAHLHDVIFPEGDEMLSFAWCCYVDIVGNKVAFQSDFYYRSKWVVIRTARYIRALAH